jgi:hypothetical protein
MARLFGQCAFALSVLSRMLVQGVVIRFVLGLQPANSLEPGAARAGECTRRRRSQPGTPGWLVGYPLILQRMIGLHNCMCAIRHLR